MRRFTPGNQVHNITRICHQKDFPSRPQSKRYINVSYAMQLHIKNVILTLHIFPYIPNEIAFPNNIKQGRNIKYTQRQKLYYSATPVLRIQGRRYFHL